VLALIALGIAAALARPRRRPGTPP